ncbi:acetyltransferase-like isoleucine patch superfamily enzyme/dTDP-4-dehydrorhamnose 3,5-epimerase-like enzyme [Pseudomonas sp. 3296]|uniref:WxcM-like domain-containing protein n=1 Tax=Pseudomonas sp. 3296 TaxID=2817753 RepID=UPI00285946A4|nr:WxcM-like domain-containing protein [Pseudomonas sp. 3296]MDR6918617.1 acetyltransferase-like isoleucine patch superfamily enzyme/dTDP-4-dehydrorhamnose 3,5-epimerase-like enzyme [Pseudomonas sp. 3296]
MSEEKDYFVHERALCESSHIGSGTRVWAFAHILPQARVGKDCNVCDHVFVENDVVIGDRVTLKCGVQVWDGISLEDDVFVGPNVTFTNDRFPRSKVYPESFSRTIICKGASLGANATILPGITIGMNAMIGAGSVVTRSVPPNAIVVGNPAKIIGYVDAKAVGDNRESTSKLSTPGVVKTSVKNVTLHHLNEVADIRGQLSVGEFERTVPFNVLRFFLVYDVPTAETRGEHAHHSCAQFLIAAHGSVHVVADDGVTREEFVLDKPNVGIYLPPMTWGIQYRYSSDAVLLVFASEYYNSQDYIRDYNEFLRLSKNAEGVDSIA